MLLLFHAVLLAPFLSRIWQEQYNGKQSISTLSPFKISLILIQVDQQYELE
jgi:hypothetical protein